MAENSAIEWTNHTWSPWEGCQKTGSPACEHCYAEARNARFGGGTPPNWGPHAPRRITSNSGWRKPWAWDRLAGERGVRERVFPSLCDPFDNKAPAGARARFGKLILGTPNLIWLLLTKRIGNATVMMTEMFGGPPPANVWIGATVVTQEEADRDVSTLISTPADKRFLSLEPLMGPIDLTSLAVKDRPDLALNSLTGRITQGRTTITDLDDRAISWVIVGGESGSGARPMHPDWARSLRDQCATAGVPFLFKQWGEHIAHAAPDARWRDGSPVPAECEPVRFERVGKKVAGRLLDGMAHDGMPSC